MLTTHQTLVSIITPCYNSKSTIQETIQSVISQTYPHWEMLIIDDCSTDGSDVIIQQYCKQDARIKYFKTEKPSGSPTLPRNIGIQNAQGRFIAFLDSDDLWLPSKLEEQIKLFENNKTAIVFSDYEKMDAQGNRNNRIIVAPCNTSYTELLKENVIGCLTAIYDTHKVGKLYFTPVGHEDFAMWLSILKRGYIAQNTNTVLALYRLNTHSVSSNKIKAFQWTWNIYRKHEHLSLYKSCYYFLHYAIRATLKYFK